MQGAKKRKRISGPAKTLLVLVIVTVLLLGFDRIRMIREVALATGPKSHTQRYYFIEAADRPGIELFYKGLTSADKVKMAQRLGLYNDIKVITLTGKLLDTFDEQAYQELTNSLIKQTKSNPKDAVSLIGVGATRPKFAIRKAMLAAVPESLGPLAEKLEDAGLRGNAKRLLIEAGPQAEPYVRKYIQSKDADVRKNAASLLGQYRKVESLGVLGKAFRAYKTPERTIYLSAIVAIGAQQNRPFFENVFSNLNYTPEERFLAAKALARLGTLQSTAPLARALLSAKGQEREKVLQALSEAGEKTLALTTLQPYDRFRLSCMLRGSRADAILSTEILKGRFDIFKNIDYMKGRDGLTQALSQLAVKLNPQKDARKAMLVLRVLSSTKSGIKALEKLQKDPKIGGLAMRTLRLNKLAKAPE